MSGSPKLSPSPKKEKNEGEKQGTNSLSPWKVTSATGTGTYNSGCPCLHLHEQQQQSEHGSVFEGQNLYCPLWLPQSACKLLHYACTAACQGAGGEGWGAATTLRTESDPNYHNLPSKFPLSLNSSIAKGLHQPVSTTAIAG